MTFRPRFIGFYGSGTRIHFEMGQAASQPLSDRQPDEMTFLGSFKARRLDDVPVVAKPFLPVVIKAIARACETNYGVNRLNDVRQPPVLPGPAATPALSAA
ncbi:MAG: hypothetical protein U5L46_11855 [Agrobacterium sp.]|nr:hypothetical protein [Agrobacterium sp.]